MGMILSLGQNSLKMSSTMAGSVSHGLPNLELSRNIWFSFQSLPLFFWDENEDWKPTHSLRAMNYCMLTKAFHCSITVGLGTGMDQGLLFQTQTPQVGSPHYSSGSRDYMPGAMPIAISMSQLP